jgi:hypothetical protein
MSASRRWQLGSVTKNSVDDFGEVQRDAGASLIPLSVIA